MGNKKARNNNNNKAPKQPTGTPTTPHGTRFNDAETPTQDGQPATNAQFPLSPVATPLTSPSSPSTDQAAAEPLQCSGTADQVLPLEQTQSISTPTQTIFNPTISVDDIISNDIITIADIFATMKKTMAIMTNAFDRFEIQTEKFASLSLDIKAAEQLSQVRKALDDQITRQKSEIEVLGDKLKTKIQEAVQEKIRTQLRDMVKASIAEKVEEKVRNELSVQIPEDLRQQIVEHRREILEIKTTLHNSEARRYNACLRRSSSAAQLRPLLRPLPTPEQSPTIIVTEDSALNSPVSALPSIKAPAPTPIKRSTSHSFKGAPSLDAVPPTPSPLFPRDLKTLFKLGAEEARTLLRQYGLVSGAASPITPKPRGHENEGTNGSLDDSAIDDGCHVKDMNTFMAHIGVPYLMIPPPKSKEPQSPPLSATTRRRMLAPLIISATPNIFY